MTRVRIGSKIGWRRSVRGIDGVPRADRPPRSQLNLNISGTPLFRHPDVPHGPLTWFARLRPRPDDFAGRGGDRATPAEVAVGDVATTSWRPPSRAGPTVTTPEP